MNLILVLLFVFFLIFLLYAYQMVKFIDKVFRNYERMYEITKFHQDHYYAFVRLDYPFWSKSKFYFGAIFLLPIRLILLVCCVIFCFTCMKIVMINGELNKPILGIRRKWIKLITSSTCRTILFIAGIYYIPYVQEKIKTYLADYVNNNTSKNQKAPIMVCNHVSWVDTLFLVSSPFCPSFLAKEEVSHIPFIGFVAKVLQALFVDRESRTDKDLVMKKIEERSELLKKTEGLPQLLIFPEGTNTNGKGIIHFKRGAFNAIENIQIICLEYPHTQFNLSMDDFGMGVNILLALCQIKNSLTAHIFEPFNPEYLHLKREEDWEKYANIVREIMSKCLKIKSCEMGFRDCLDFTEFLKLNDVIEGRKMNPHNEFSPDRKSSSDKRKTDKKNI